MLGMMPALGRFTGLPIDVRHVTLNSGILALAASGVERASDTHWWILRAVLGIATMFVLNLSVSFACSLVSAARAYEVSNDDLYGILKSMGRRFLRSPLEFVRRPPANAHGGHA
jgi:site-specific recombinase